MSGLVDKVYHDDCISRLNAKHKTEIQALKAKHASIIEAHEKELEAQREACADAVSDIFGEDMYESDVREAILSTSKE